MTDISDLKGHVRKATVEFLYEHAATELDVYHDHIQPHGCYCGHWINRKEYKQLIAFSIAEQLDGTETPFLCLKDIP